MADKEIIINDLKEMIYKLQIECAEKTDNILALGEQLKSVEKTIEILEAKIGGYEYAISDIVKEYQGKLDRKEQEYEELKEELEAVYDDCKGCSTCNEALYNANLYAKKYKKLKQTLAEIKPILEFYANSKMGEEQPDRTYKIMLSGGYIMVYDPKPAREALRKINEVEDEKNV